jgi:hypothetical protein
MAAASDIATVKAWSRPPGYRGLNLQRAMRSGFLNTSPTNRATHTLWNNSQGQHYLLVRSVQISTTGSSTWMGQTVQTPAGTSQGAVISILPNRAPGPGLHYYQDTATALTPDFGFGQQAVSPWAHEFPFAVLPPGYGLAVAPNVNTIVACIGFFWEYVLAEHLDDWFEY